MNKKLKEIMDRHGLKQLCSDQYAYETGGSGSETIFAGRFFADLSDNGFMIDYMDLCLYGHEVDACEARIELRISQL